MDIDESKTLQEVGDFAVIESNYYDNSEFILRIAKVFLDIFYGNFYFEEEKDSFDLLSSDQEWIVISPPFFDQYMEGYYQFHIHMKKVNGQIFRIYTKIYSE